MSPVYRSPSCHVGTVFSQDSRIVWGAQCDSLHVNQSGIFIQGHVPGKQVAVNSH